MGFGNRDKRKVAEQIKSFWIDWSVIIGHVEHLTWPSYAQDDMNPNK